MKKQLYSDGGGLLRLRIGVGASARGDGGELLQRSQIVDGRLVGTGTRVALREGV